MSRCKLTHPSGAGAVRLVARGRISSDASSQAKPAQLGPYPYRLAELVG